MKLHKYFFVLLVFVTATAPHARAWEPGIATGFGTYKMTNLKSIMEGIGMQNPYGAVLVTNFPGFVYMQPYLIFKTDDYNTGFSLSFNNTGSRWSIRDYSGEFKIDAHVKTFAPAYFYEWKLFEFNRFELGFRADVGLAYNSVRFEEYFRLDQTVYEDAEYKFRSLNIFLAPQFNLRYPLNSRVSLVGFAGYHADLIRGVMVNRPGEFLSLNYFFYEGDTVDWSGLRAGVGVEVKL
jgi:hypothetical protein